VKICLELHSETLADVRAELEAFLTSNQTAAPVTGPEVTAPAVIEPPAKAEPAIVAAPTGTTPSSSTRKSKGRSATVDTATAAPSAADVALAAAADTSPRSKPSSAPKSRPTRSAADIALGLEPEEDTNEASPDGEDPEQLDIEDLLAAKADLTFAFDRVLALQGRAAALGIVQGTIPTAAKLRLKEIDDLPPALIPSAIAALQAAQAA
jgi:hypothetical protein